MVVLSAAVVGKDGTIYIGKHYCGWSKSTFEGLYTAFSRLITKGKQHTVINGNKVTYLYQPLNDFYCVIITDKHSNILEDIKTLDLFVRAVSEYAAVGKSQIYEESIEDSRYDINLAFDEIVAHEYRQTDSIGQLRIVMEMKSEEEKAFLESLTRKEKEAKAKLAEKAKELDQLRRNEMLQQSERLGGRGMGSNLTSISSDSKSTEPTVESDLTAIKPQRVMSKGRAMKLKVKKVDTS